MEKKKALPGRLWQRKVWLFCEEPESSKAAKVRHISCELQNFKNRKHTYAYMHISD